jgi:tripartite-type tricarboxylate transporter receptor subunit TctC
VAISAGMESSVGLRNRVFLFPGCVSAAEVVRLRTFIGGCETRRLHFTAERRSSMSRRIWCSAMGLAVLAFNLNFAHAASDDVFKGNTVKIVVGLTAGGAFDAYARTLARYLGKHIPGNPTFVVDNMPGAGGLVAANYVYKVAKPDGLTIGNFLGGVFMGQILGRPGIEFDALKFEYVGSPMKDNPVCAFSKASGITSIDKWMTSKTPVKLGATGPGATTHDVALILKATLGLPTQLISGYKGAPELQLAVDGGELAGVCNSWESLRVTSTRALEAGELIVVVQAIPRAHPELPKVPLAIDLAKTDESRRIIQAGIHDMTAIVRPYVLPPGTPKQQVQLLRKAFTDTLKDPEFLSDAKKSKLDLDPLTGEELEATVSGLLKMSPATLAKLKELFK